MQVLQPERPNQGPGPKKSPYFRYGCPGLSLGPTSINVQQSLPQSQGSGPRKSLDFEFGFTGPGPKKSLDFRSGCPGSG